MAFNRWRAVTRRRPNSPRRRPFAYRLVCERLEDRLAPAARFWDGMVDGGAVSAAANWMTDTNWVGDVRPDPGDDLFFPEAAELKTNFDDFAAGTLFNTITFSGNGYSVTGNAVTLAAGLSADAGVTVAASFGLGITLAAAQSFTVADGGAVLTVSGAIDGAAAADLSKEGGGTLVLSGDSTYQGATA